LDLDPPPALESPAKPNEPERDPAPPSWSSVNSSSDPFGSSGVAASYLTPTWKKADPSRSWSTIEDDAGVPVESLHMGGTDNVAHAPVTGVLPPTVADSPSSLWPPCARVNATLVGVPEPLEGAPPVQQDGATDRPDIAN
jgi:hypothetical protein